MAEEVFIPKLGQTVEEVTLVSWLVEDGTKVEFGTPLMEVETDKAIFTVEANANGYMQKGPFDAGQVLPVLTVVATIGKKDEAFTAGSPAAAAVDTDTDSNGSGSGQAVTQSTAGETSAPAAPAPAAPEGEKRFVSPRARRLAREKHVDLSRVAATGGQGKRIVEKDVIAYLSQLPKTTPVAANMAAQMGLDLTGMVGSGVRGAVTKSDIEKAVQGKAPAAAPAAAPAPVPAPYQPPAAVEGEVLNRVPLSGVRGIIFDRMATSVHTTARVTLVSEVDATDFVAAREKLKEKVSKAWGFTPGYNDLLALIVARALREFPQMNARVSADGKAVEWMAQVNLGLAVDTERGLLVPVVRNADRKGLREFGTEFRQLVDRARVGRSLPDDLSGGTFTITNLGMYDVDAFTPVINLPEAAILGVGRIHEKVVPYQGKIEVRKVMTFSLVFDHRLNDGAPAARFLTSINQMVENPLLLLG